MLVPPKAPLYEIARRAVRTGFGGALQERAAFWRSRVICPDSNVDFYSIGAKTRTLPDLFWTSRLLPSILYPFSSRDGHAETFLFLLGSIPRCLSIAAMRSSAWSISLL